MRAETAASYDARGGQKNLRDSVLKDLHLSNLSLSLLFPPIGLFEQVSELAHSMDRFVLRGK